jgi:DNA-binding MarR family transcriptional regulator
MTEDAGFDAIAAMPGHLLRRCQQIAVAIFLQECEALDLTPLQYVVLGALDAGGEMDQNRLGGLTALDRTTVGTVLSKLEDRGLVQRRRSDSDKRSNAITLTDCGRALLEKAVPAVAGAQTRILAPLAPADRDRFIGYLQQVADGNNQESRAPLRR